MRSKKYIGCYILKNNHLPIEKFKIKTNNPIEHLFNNHDWCDKEKCWAKELDSRTFDTMVKIGAIVVNGDVTTRFSRHRN